MFNQEPDNYTCPFCRMIINGLHKEKDVVLQTENVFACLAMHQHEGSGPSLLIIPKLHVENLYDISDALLAEVSSVSKLVAINMRELWDIQGITIWQHNEKAGYQDVWHFHTHVKGRLDNDDLYNVKQIEVGEERRHVLAQDLRNHIESN